MREDKNTTDWETTLKITLIMFVLTNAIGFSIWLVEKHDVNPDAISILESSGYTKVDVWGRDPRNCPSRHGSTLFYAYTDTTRIKGVLCTQIYGDSTFVRVLEEY